MFSLFIFYSSRVFFSVSEVDAAAAMLSLKHASESKCFSVGLRVFILHIDFSLRH